MLLLQLLQPDHASVDEIEPVDIVRHRALAVLHEPQRAAAGQDNILALLRDGGGGAQQGQQNKGEQEAHARVESNGNASLEKGKSRLGATPVNLTEFSELTKF